MKFGVYVLGVAAIATGIVDLVWGKFESAHEPIQAWGDNLTGQGGFADVVAIVLIVGGAAVLWRQSARIGAVLLGIAYLIFAIFWAPRIYWTMVIPGVGWPGTIGAIGGIGQQAIVIAAAALIYADATPGSRWTSSITRIAPLVFGISVIFFGLAHLTGVGSTAPMVPKWIPPNADFWVVFTGIAFIAAGIAISSGVLGVLAARLLTLMFLVFAALVLPRYIFQYPHNEIPWGSNAYNLAAVGATWVLADWLAGRRRLRLQTGEIPNAG
ncbi:MAG TPA: hypothetical protein VFF63_05305 [Candidatus Babeliales bacterium]|nr:hypothetical protein [Candidatus Babeliales bacterium]